MYPNKGQKRRIFASETILKNEFGHFKMSKIKNPQKSLCKKRGPLRPLGAFFESLKNHVGSFCRGTKKGQNAPKKNQHLKKSTDFKKIFTKNCFFSKKNLPTFYVKETFLKCSDSSLDGNSMVTFWKNFFLKKIKKYPSTFYVGETI